MYNGQEVVTYGVMMLHRAFVQLDLAEVFAVQRPT